MTTPSRLLWGARRVMQVPANLLLMACNGVQGHAAVMAGVPWEPERSGAFREQDEAGSGSRPVPWWLREGR